MNIFRKFFRDSSGSYIPLFGFLVVPLVGLIGAAIDYSRAARVKTEMQSALDQTVLALSREVGVTATPAKLSTRANELFKALSPVQAHDLLADIVLTASNTDNTISLTATSRVKAEFMAVVGIKEIPVGGESVATWGSRKIDIALVLDNTGSMSRSSKMTELKKAATLLVDTFVPANQAQADTVRIGVVPFSTMVRMPDTIKPQGFFTTYQETYDYWGRKTGSQVLSASPPKDWIGCVVDRNQSYDVIAAAPTALDQKFPATNETTALNSTSKTYCSNVTVMLPLTSDLSTVKTTISLMNPNGNTNVTIGVMWGQQVLSGLRPTPESRDPAQVKDLSKIMIVLTDGDNTENRWSNTSSTIDARTAIACTNAKAAGLTVYTIRLIDGDEALLKACASDPSMYYSVKSASELTAVFASIAQKIADLRLAK